MTWCKPFVTAAQFKRDMTRLFDMARANAPDHTPDRLGFDREMLDARSAIITRSLSPTDRGEILSSVRTADDLHRARWSIIQDPALRKTLFGSLKVQCRDRTAEDLNRAKWSILPDQSFQSLQSDRRAFRILQDDESLVREAPGIMRRAKRSNGPMVKRPRQRPADDGSFGLFIYHVRLAWKYATGSFPSVHAFDDEVRRTTMKDTQPFIVFLRDVVKACGEPVSGYYQDIVKNTTTSINHIEADAEDMGEEDLCGDLEFD